MKLFLILMISGSLGFEISSLSITWSRETHLMIQNYRNSPVEDIQVTDVDDHDFEKGSGPQDKFKGVVIPSKSIVQRQIEVNNWATRCPFTMHLTFGDGTKAQFTLNQKFAAHEGQSEFKYEAPFTISFEQVGNTNIIKLHNR